MSRASTHTENQPGKYEKPCPLCGVQINGQLSSHVRYHCEAAGSVVERLDEI